MNTFKREYLLFKRGKLLYILIPVISLMLSLWIIYGLRVFSYNYMDISQVFTIIPLLCGLFIPLLTYGVWNREVRLGLDRVILLYENSFRVHIYKKVLFYLLFFILLSVMVNLQVSAFNYFTDIDRGLLLTVNLGIMMVVFLSISISVLLSLWIKNRILYSVIGMVVVQLLQWLPFVNDFYTGIIDLKVVVLVITTSVMFIELFLFMIEKRYNKPLLTLTLLFFMLSLFWDIRIDMTDTGRYTLQTYSQRYIKEIDSSIIIDLYLSDDDKNTEMLIKQFHQLDGVSGSIYFENNEKTTDSFKDAVRVYQPIKDDDDRYNFIVISLNSRVMVIPRLVLYDTLEFEIVRVLQYLRDGQLKKVALYMGNSDFREENFQSFSQLISEHVESTILFPGDPIAENLDLLIVIDHYDINAYYTDQIISYIERGGHILFAVNGLDTGNNLQYRETPTLQFLKDLDIHVQPYLIGDKRSIGVVEDNGSVKEYPLNLQAFPNRTLKDNSILSPFTGLTALHSSPVVTLQDKYQYLLFSSREAWLVDSTSGVNGTPETQFPIALYGELDSGSRMVTIGNTLGLTEFNDNQDFFLRVIYYLIGDEELLSLRHKFNWERSMYKIETSLYRGTLINSMKVYLLTSPLWILLLLTVFDKILVFFWIRSKSN